MDPHGAPMANANLPKTLLPVLFVGGLLLAAWTVVAPFVTALAWAVMIAYRRPSFSD